MSERRQFAKTVMPFLAGVLRLHNICAVRIGKRRSKTPATPGGSVFSYTIYWYLDRQGVHHITQVGNVPSLGVVQWSQVDPVDWPKIVFI